MRDKKQNGCFEKWNQYKIFTKKKKNENVLRENTLRWSKLKKTKHKRKWKEIHHFFLWLLLIRTMTLYTWFRLSEEFFIYIFLWSTESCIVFINSTWILGEIFFTCSIFKCCFKHSSLLFAIFGLCQKKYFSNFG